MWALPDETKGCRVAAGLSVLELAALLGGHCNGSREVRGWMCAREQIQGSVPGRHGAKKRLTLGEGPGAGVGRRERTGGGRRGMSGDVKKRRGGLVRRVLYSKATQGTRQHVVSLSRSRGHVAMSGAGRRGDLVAPMQPIPTPKAGAEERPLSKTVQDRLRLSAARPSPRRPRPSTTENKKAFPRPSSRQLPHS